VRDRCAGRQVRFLANKLGGDPVAEKLERAIANDNTIVALNQRNGSGSSTY